MKPPTQKTQTAAELDTATRDLVLQTDLSNVIKKVKAGKPLTTAERRLIEAQESKTTSPDAWPAAFDTLTACAARTGVPLAILRSAKAKGCPGFKSGRVYFAQFLRWHFADEGNRETPDYQFEKGRLTRALAEEKERENSIATGELHTLAEVERIVWHEGLAKVREAWTNYPKTAGLKLRSVLEAAGVAPATIKQAVETACEGVTEPLARLAEMVAKKEGEK